MIIFFNNIDQTILFFIQTNFHTPILNKVMILFTAAGDKGFVWILISLLLLINKKTRYIGMVTLGALVLSTIAGEGILKHIIQRPRSYVDFPSIQLLVGKPTTYSFPSGHTASSFAAAYVLSKYLKKISPLIWIVAITIAFSRLYLFMHYPSDVVAGIVLGLICGKVALYMYEHKIKKREEAGQGINTGRLF